MNAPPKPAVVGYHWVNRPIRQLKVGNIIYTESEAAFVHFGKICYINSSSVKGIWSNNVEDLLNVDLLEYDKLERARSDKMGRGSFTKDDTSYQTWWVLEKEEDKSPFNVEIVEV